MFEISLWATMTPVYFSMGENAFYSIKKERIAYNHEIKPRI